MNQIIHNLWTAITVPFVLTSLSGAISHRPKNERKNRMKKFVDRMFRGKTYDAQTGAPVQPVARVSRPQSFLHNLFTLFLLVLTLAYAMGMKLWAQATDIATAVTTLGTLWNGVEALGILILLFVIGRRFLRKV
jgi:hypothetical protein